jgi:hypothetical protein
MTSFPVLVIDYPVIGSRPPGKSIYSTLMGYIGRATSFMDMHDPIAVLAGDYGPLPSPRGAPILIAGDSSGGGSAASALTVQVCRDRGLLMISASLA